MKTNGLLEREKEVLRLIDFLKEKNLDFIVIGGYAISTYKKRFSVDLDIVIKEEDLSKFEDLLLKEGYFLNYEKEIAFIYGENFKRFRKKINDLPVDVDLLINGVVARATDASWGFESIYKNSQKRNLDYLEFLIPIKEMLISMKIHSGRLSDTRDIIALMPCDKLDKFLLKGDLKKLKTSIKNQISFIEKPQFEDSFKGIFGIQAYDKKQIELAKILLNNHLRSL